MFIPSSANLNLLEHLLVSRTSHLVGVNYKMMRGADLRTTLCRIKSFFVLRWPSSPTCFSGNLPKWLGIVCLFETYRAKHVYFSFNLFDSLLNYYTHDKRKTFVIRLSIFVHDVQVTNRNICLYIRTCFQCLHGFFEVRVVNGFLSPIPADQLHWCSRYLNLGTWSSAEWE